MRKSNQLANGHFSSESEKLHHPYHVTKVLMLADDWVMEAWSSDHDKQLRIWA